MFTRDIAVNTISYVSYFSYHRSLINTSRVTTKSINLHPLQDNDVFNLNHGFTNKRLQLMYPLRKRH